MSNEGATERHVGARSELVNVNGDTTVGRPCRPPAYRLLADDLRAQIVSGELRPGDRLPPEPQLCQRSGLSRSTIREALRLLASEHLIVTTRGVTGGSFVAQPSPAKLAETLSAGVRLMLASGELTFADVLQVRRIADLPAVEFAAMQRSESLIASLRSTLVEAGPEWDPVSVARKAFAFHDIVASATGNSLYQLLCRPLYDVPAELAASAIVSKSFWRQVDQEHLAIIEAIEAGDPEAAMLATQAHLDRVIEDPAIEGLVVVYDERSKPSGQLPVS